MERMDQADRMEHTDPAVKRDGERNCYMKPKLTAALCLAALLPAAAVTIGAAAITAAVDHTAETNIISWFVADMDNDSLEELLVVVGNDPNMVLDTGEAYGDQIKIYSDFEITDHKPVVKGEPDLSFDLSDIKPMKIQAGDINGDGVVEIAVCVYKTTKFHPVPAKRPFFYDLADGGLEPVWLGSRLSRPFDQYILHDMDGDGADEIISIERTEQGDILFAAYDWKGFGFEVTAVSDEVKEEAFFSNHINHKEKNISVTIAGESYMLRLENETLILTQE